MDPFWIHRCRIDPARNVIACDLPADTQPAERPLEPKVMAVLCQLAEHPGEVVSRSALLDTIWRDQPVADESLTRAVSVLRKAFRSFVDEPVIETIPKRGYRLLPAVFCVSDENAGLPEALTVPPAHSIAVLAFTDLSAAGDQEHLADGVSEEILNALTQLSTLKVSGRTSSFSFKHRSVSIPEISKALNVRYVLEGSLRVHGVTARITAQLIDCDGYHLWSQTYDRALCDIFRLQEDIARAIAAQIAGLVTVEATAAQPSVPVLTGSAEAYELFSQGRDLTHKLNGQTTIPAGIGLLERAVKLDPGFAEAWAWLGLAHFILPEFSRAPDWRLHVEESRRAVDQALTAQPNCSMALLVKALQTTYDHRIDEAIGIYEQALELDPNNVETIAGYGLGMLAIGRHDLARQSFDRVLAQDPLCGLWHTVYGGIQLNAGEFHESERSFKQSFDLGFGAAAFGVAHRMAERGEGKPALCFLKDNFDGLAPVEQAELRSPLIRHLVFKAYLLRPRLERSLIAQVMKRRLHDPAAQPTSASVISFLFLEEPGAFLENMLKKPNPYLGYTIARIWEPTRQSALVREHPAFPEFVEATGLTRAWARFGQPLECAVA